MAVKGPVVAEADIGRVAEAGFVRLPDPATLYARRAARLRALAADHPMGNFLAFVATIADAQHVAARDLPPSAPPGPDRLERARRARMPLFGRNDGGPGPAWLASLDRILQAVDIGGMPPASRAAWEQAARLDPAARDGLADRLLTGRVGREELGVAVFATAALQLHWAGLARGLDPAAIHPLDPGGLCPVCGSLPLVSVLDGGPGVPSPRYLHCSLCETQWHYTRIKCADCGSTKGIAYHAIEGVEGPMRAETCDSCGTYVKILSRDKAPEVEPLADDLATVPLDIMVAEAGWHRLAANPFLLTG